VDCNRRAAHEQAARDAQLDGGVPGWVACVRFVNCVPAREQAAADTQRDGGVPGWVAYVWIVSACLLSSKRQVTQHMMKVCCPGLWACACVLEACPSMHA